MTKFIFGRGFTQEYPKELYFTSGYTHMNYIISVDPAQFNPSQNIASRYSTKIVNSNCYGTISNNIRWEDEI